MFPFAAFATVPLILPPLLRIPEASLLMPFPLCPSTGKLGTLALISPVLDILDDLGQCLFLSGPQFSHVCSWVEKRGGGVGF